MDEFDLSVPYTATIVFDDSDEETYDIKPSSKNYAESENETPKVTQPQEVTFVPTAPKTNIKETDRINKHTLESIKYEIAKNVAVPYKYLKEEFLGSKMEKRDFKPETAKTNRFDNHSPQKPLDMPILDEVISGNSKPAKSIVNKEDKNNESILKRNTNSKKNKNSKSLTEIKDVSEKKRITNTFFMNPRKKTDSVSQKKPIDIKSSKKLKIKLVDIFASSVYEPVRSTLIENKKISENKFTEQVSNAEQKLQTQVRTEDKDSSSNILTEELNNAKNTVQKKTSNEIEDISEKEFAKELCNGHIEPKTQTPSTKSRDTSKRRVSDELNFGDHKIQKTQYIITENSQTNKTNDKLNLTNENNKVHGQDLGRGQINSGDIVYGDHVPTSTPGYNNLQQIDDKVNYLQHRANYNKNTNIHFLPNTKISNFESKENNTAYEKTSPFYNVMTPPAQTTNQEQPTNGGTTAQNSEIAKTDAVGYLEELLKTISEHLIFILSSYQTYVKCHTSKMNHTFIENDRNNYLRIRNHFFDLSYTTVLNVIIPRDNDATFVKNFIANTMRIAQAKSCNCSQEQIKLLYVDMIKWVRKRQEGVHNIMNTNTMAHPVLVQELKKPVPSTNHLRKPRKQNPSKPPSKNVNDPLHSHKRNLHDQPTSVVQPQLLKNIWIPPTPYPLDTAHQSQIFVETSPGTHRHSFEHAGSMEQILKPNQQGARRPYYENPIHNTYSNQNTFQSLNDSLQQIDKKINSLQHRLNYNKNTNIQGAILHQNTAPSWQVSTKQNHAPHPSKQYKTLPTSTPGYNNLQQIDNKVNYLQHRPNYNKNTNIPDSILHQNTASSWQVSTKQNHAPHPSEQNEALPTSTPGYNNLQQIDDKVNYLQHRANYNKNTNIQGTILHQNTAPSWEISTKQNHAPHRSEQYEVLPINTPGYQQNYLQVSPQNNQQFRPENPAQTDPNRSISRDSGFMSPLNFNANGDLLLPEEQTTNTPLITHVTSLNPNATLIEDGICAICYKITKQKCLGCFKLYYCSHACQFLDWNNHRLVCK